MRWFVQVQRVCLEAEKERDVNTKENSAVGSHQEGIREVREKYK